MQRRPADYVGPNTLKRASEQREWILARAIDSLIYDLSDVAEPAGIDPTLRVRARAFLHGATSGERVPTHIAKTLPWLDGDYYDVRHMLRDAMDELERIAILKVT